MNEDEKDDPFAFIEGEKWKVVKATRSGAWSDDDESDDDSLDSGDDCSDDEVYDTRYVNQL